MVCVAMMLACDVFPALLPAGIHGFVEAVPLALIALAYLLYQGVHRPPPKEWLEERSCWPPPFSSGRPISSGQTPVRRRSSTISPSRFSCWMSSW